MYGNCPCCSLIPYLHCCNPLHAGEKASTALALMRSRYAAYKLGLIEYIQQTTAPMSPHFESDRVRWTAALQQFCQATTFIKLEIISSGFNWVHFCAYLEQEKKPICLNEKSHFEQVDSRWMYLDGELS